MRTHWSADIFDRQARRGWFAETLVVLGILAFAYFAITLQGRSRQSPSSICGPLDDR